ncbi:hypothetical protein [Methylorubrum salsuginis]|uniref:Uncharacterized protein n=1 Tax=Methylorubrum salsuginis TaxID=414703 RepID=A0A1I4C6S1_9HYPH|nr:hypothetical protein [Methylorubrum salsuginis]SFK76310.1 hypothetical protein SAMN04488125_10461 [Methylorubrum salsuginis]
MAGTAETWIEVRAVERTLDPTSGSDRMRVRFEYGSEGGILCEWAIWLPDEGGFDAAVRLAREELQRISALMALEQLVEPS